MKQIPKTLIFWLLTSTASAYECETKAIYSGNKEYLSCETREFEIVYEHDPREMSLEHCLSFCQVDQEDEHDFPERD